MKKLWCFGLLLAACGVSRSIAAGDAPALTPAQKVLVWAQAKDPAIEQAVEFELQGRLADRQIVSERYSKVFPRSSGASPTHNRSDMKQLAMDTLVVLQPERNIQWPTETPGSGESALDLFLATPPGDFHPVDVAPPGMVPGDAVGTQVSGVAAPARGPIQGNQGPAPQHVLKVGAIVFDIATGKIIWKGKYPVRVPLDLPAASYSKLIAEGAIKTLSKNGVVSTVR